MHPSRMRLGHSGLAIGFIVVHPLVVAKSGIGDDIEDDEEDEDDDVDDGDFPPAMLEAAEHTCLARVASVAQLLLVVAPPRAIHVGPG